MLHSGDCRTGELEGDDEQITIDLLHTQPNVRAMAIVINCYSQGFTFRDVETAEARITDVTNQKGMTQTFHGLRLYNRSVAFTSLTSPCLPGLPHVFVSLSLHVVVRVVRVCMLMGGCVCVCFIAL